MVKRGLVLLIVVFLIPFVTAQEGCFLYEGSPLYCQAISRAQAEQECSFSDDCFVGVFFQENTRCEAHISCQKILCKSSCRSEFSGNCPAGPVPQGEEQQWCSPGCCQIPGGECQFMQSKWLCEVAALNAGQQQFQYTLLSKAQCVNECNSPGLPGEFERVNPPVIQQATSLETTSFSEKPVPQSVQQTEQPAMNPLFILWIIFFICLAIIAYVLLRLKKPSHKKKVSRNVGEKEAPRFLSPFSSNPKVREHISELHKKHILKTKQLHRDLFLDKFKQFSAAIPQESPQFKKLRRLVKYYEERQQPLTKEEESLFAQLEKLVNPPQADGRSKRKQEVDELFQRLQELSRR